ncbi:MULTISPECIES: DNA-directed RNA polymerase subunit beta [Bacillus]|uniref:DNA-directed RNA polymerase subunit beta n=1 Tax=Bacillus TaxID=1386 RepID=UPI000BB85572|nr:MULTISPECIES: DNA-directed RNA polymerase subunit beta [Bacillus]
MEEKRPSTREQLRAQKKQQKKAQSEELQYNPNKKFRPRMRVIPIWIRLVLLLAFLAVSTIAGAMFGYAILGDGDPRDVLNKETWQHIIDLVKN